MMLAIPRKRRRHLDVFRRFDWICVNADEVKGIGGPEWPLTYHVYLDHRQHVLHTRITIFLVLKGLTKYL